MPDSYIGCSGFSERSWKGEFYPEDLQTKDYLKYYSQKLNAVEINSTFYRKPTEKILKNWYDSTPKNFKFFIKIPKTFTHLKKMKDIKNELSDFKKYIKEHLKEKLGGFLFQLPPSFKKSEENLFSVLNEVLGSGSDGFLNVVEFRNGEWWDEETIELLAENNIVFSGVSIPKNGIPDTVIKSQQGALCYRLHGVPVMFKSEYSEEFLENLADEIKGFGGEKYIFFNKTWGIAGIKNALKLKEITS